MTLLQRIKYTLLLAFIGFPLAALLDLLGRLASRRVERRVARRERAIERERGTR